MNTSLLQPDDSKRVANAIIAAIKNETDGIGPALVREISRSIESCLGSYEMGEIVRKAIESGIITREDA